jgi:hypothetical protein
LGERNRKTTLFDLRVLHFNSSFWNSTFWMQVKTRDVTVPYQQINEKWYSAFSCSLCSLSDEPKEKKTPTIAALIWGYGTVGTGQRVVLDRPRRPCRRDEHRSARTFDQTDAGNGARNWSAVPVLMQRELGRPNCRARFFATSNEMLVNFNRVSTSTRRLAFDLPTFCALLSNVGGMICIGHTERTSPSIRVWETHTHTHLQYTCKYSIAAHACSVSCQNKKVKRPSRQNFSCKVIEGHGDMRLGLCRSRMQSIKS